MQFMHLLPKGAISLLIFVTVTSCNSPKKQSHYDALTEYEGQFEYFSPAGIVLATSDFDTTLYAILDDAKYPLTYISKDTFANASKKPVIFQRNDKGEIQSFQSDNSTFKIKDKSIAKYEWFPRKELFNDAEKYEYRIPEKRNDGLEVGDVKEAFAHSENILEMVKATIKNEYPDVHSILILKDDKLVLEEYFYDYDIEKPHQLRSASKSFIGTLMGIAIDQGKISSEKEKLLSVFKEAYPTIANRDSRKEKITLEDFLTYRHGMDCDDENPETKGNEMRMIESSDWVKFTLDLPMVNEPGVSSAYCTACAQTLGRVVELKTGIPLVEYADKNLFGPMGITNYKWRFKPDTSSILTFNQMYLRPRDMIKLAKMYKDDGKWLDKQIVSSDWVKKTFKNRMLNLAICGDSNHLRSTVKNMTHT